MNNDKFEKLGPILAAIGQEAAEIVGGEAHGVYIYGEVERATQFASIFQEEEKAIRYYSPSPKLFELLDDAWTSEDPDESKRWTVIEYQVNGARFDVSFTYPEELDPDGDCGERCDVAVEKRYGRKPVIYPPVPEEFQEIE